MQITFVNGRFEAISSFYEKDPIKAAGFRWDPVARRWWTADAKRAARFASVADAKALPLLAAIKAEVEAERRDAAESLRLSRATDADLAIPVPSTCELLPFQKAGVGYALRRPGCLIGDEMGLGKTVQALALINTLEAKRVLIICPASLRPNWAREAKKWVLNGLTIGLADAKSVPSTDIVIIHYDIVHTHEAALRAITWDLMVCDEAHYMKSGAKARRALYVLGGSKNIKGQTVKITPIPAKKKVFLTGTPILNRPLEIFPLAQALCPDKFSNFWEFVNKFTNVERTRYGYVFDGGKNLDQLQQLLRETIMVRRLKADVLTELPAKRRQVVEIPVDSHVHEVADEWDAVKDHQERLCALRAAVELAKASDSLEGYRAAVEALRAGTGEAFTELARVRHQTALVKVPYVASHIKSIVEDEGHKVVVFTHHKDVAKKLTALFDGQAVICTGDTPMDERQKVADVFQNNPGVRVFVGTFAVASVGLTLTAASRVVFAELDWVPSNLMQAEDRCHRIGQQDSVLVQHLVLSGSLDQVMAERVCTKMDLIDKALDKAVEANVPLLPVFSKDGGAEVTRDEIIKASEKVSEAQCQAVLAAIRHLMSLSGGHLTPQGFNGIDLPVGAALAAEKALTPRKAALGQVLVRRYAAQVPEALVRESGVKVEIEDAPF